LSVFRDRGPKRLALFRETRPRGRPRPGDALALGRSRQCRLLAVMHRHHGRAVSALRRTSRRWGRPGGRNASATRLSVCQRPLQRSPPLPAQESQVQPGARGGHPRDRGPGYAIDECLEPSVERCPPEGEDTCPPDVCYALAGSREAPVAEHEERPAIGNGRIASVPGGHPPDVRVAHTGVRRPRPPIAVD